MSISRMSSQNRQLSPAANNKHTRSKCWRNCSGRCM